MAKSGSIKRDDPYPTVGKPHLQLVKSDKQEQSVNAIRFEDGMLFIDNPDGTTTVETNPEKSKIPGARKHDASFDANLAFDMPQSQLGEIASELLDGVQRDELSRQEWMQTRALGIQLLGLKLEKPRTDLGGSSAPLEGMSTVRHPLLLEATVSGQATARAELLPAAGPVKVRNDSQIIPRNVLTTPNQADPDNPYPTLPPPHATANNDERAEALERGLNHYLLTCTDYVADTDRMLFYVMFGGDGFKKVFNCPLRRMSVSESVDADDLIISNSATDLKSCGRKTHRMKMRKSTIKRMQIAEIYRDCDLAPPTQTAQTQVEKKEAEIGGYNPNVAHPEDRDYEVLEIYCELDLDEFAPKRFKNKGLPLPYRVTIERQSRQILDVRRNWDEHDKDCTEKQYFVQFPMVRGLGFYGLGYIHLLGNTTIALTAAWRLQLDNGMFSNFPGFLYSKGMGRQLTNQFRVPPGGGVGLEIGSQQSIKDAVMPLPYKEVGASFAGFVTHLEETARRMAQTANINVGEGKQDAPVGTTLALIEQATKVMDSAHKRLHAAQEQEFKLLVERIRENPAAFLKHSKLDKQWEKDQFLEALNDYHVVPVSDPNNPTSLHRLAKAMAIKELQKANPNLYDPIGVDMRVMQISDIDPIGLFRQTPATPAPDPRMVAIQEKAASNDRQNQIQLMEAQIKAQTETAQIQDKAQERASREKIEGMKIQLELLKIQEEQIIHKQQMQNDTQAAQHKMALDQVAKQQELQMNHVAKTHEIHQKHMENQFNVAAEAQKQQGMNQIEQQKGHSELQMEQQKHSAEMAKAAQKHTQEMEHAREMHAAELELQQKMAEAVGPSEKAKTKREDEAHKQEMGHEEKRMKMETEEHKAGLQNDKVLTKAKAKAVVTKPKDSGTKKPAKKESK